MSACEVSTIKKMRKPKVAPKKVIRMGQGVFKEIVKMCYEMKYANRFREAPRMNIYRFNYPDIFHYKTVMHYAVNDSYLPFDIIQDVKYDKIKIGDIIVHLGIDFKNKMNKRLLDYIVRLSKVVRINMTKNNKISSFSTINCDQDGAELQYNPEEDFDFETQEHRKDFNKQYIHKLNKWFVIISGTKHIPFE
jgi:hypothetical protein